MTGRRMAALAAVMGALGARAADAPAPAPAASERLILDYLNEAIGWYHQQVAQAQLARDPSDAEFAAAARRQALQILQLAFAFARAEVALLPQAAEGVPATPPGQTNAAAIARAEGATASALTSAESAVASLERRVEASAGRKRALLESQLAEAKSEAELARARHDTIASFEAFLKQAGGESGGAGFLSQIEDLERSVPEAAGGVAGSAPAPTSPAAATAERPTAPSGMVALVSNLFTLGRKRERVHTATSETAALRASVDKMRGPLRDDLRSTLQRGGQFSGEAQSSDLAVLAERKRDLDQLTAHFKLVAAAMVPLGKQAVLLGTYASMLDEWRGGLDAEFDTNLRALLLRFGVLALGMVFVLVVSELWRRATFRYVRDARRRQQSLLVRRILVAAAACIMIAFSLVTELGSLATFAGFITAGLAVALQNVILSVVAYFFLIGKYGVRVGDRVQISGIDGDVIDIGLVRLHLMELRADGHPTGRVVAFSNAVLFQSSSNFFKQLPGSNFTWHQVALTFSPGTDYRAAERQLLGAVEAVYAQYREGITRQHEDVARNLSIRVEAPKPESQLKLNEGGLEMTIRYPVSLESASQMDDQVTRALLDAVEAMPRLAVAGSPTPTIRAVPEPSAR